MRTKNLIFMEDITISRPNKLFTKAKSVLNTVKLGWFEIKRTIETVENIQKFELHKFTQKEEINKKDLSLRIMTRIKIKVKDLTQTLSKNTALVYFCIYFYFYFYIYFYFIIINIFSSLRIYHYIKIRYFNLYSVNGNLESKHMIIIY